MEQTIENLLNVINTEYSNFGVFEEHSDIREMGINSIDASEMLDLISSAFNISFDEFIFNKYFLTELEISKSLS